MKKLTLFSILIFALVLAGCNLPGSQQDDVESDDSMATEIAKILTGTPVEIQPSATPVVEEPTEAEEPTEVEETEEPTLEPTDTPEETEEPEPTATPEDEEETPTPTAEPTETLAETDPARTLGEPDWIDTLADSEGWAIGYSEYSSIEFEDGYLKLTADLDVDAWRLTWPFLEDFYLEAKMQSPECEGNDHFGIMFRVPANANANRGYLFGITCDGKYGLRRWDGQVMYSPIAWTESDAINQGEDEMNTMGIMAEGAQLTFYINGEKVDEVSDNAYLAGSFGIFVGGTNVDDLTVWVDQIRYWTIE
ncbi:MAG: family 16 glycoside hydrolase [Brevefilum sp.]|nr:family 16 glycoside hydrolase [Brevefilum sp.]